MKTSHRSLFVTVLSLMLALNNGAFLALSLVGVDAPGSNATAASTPNTSLFQRTTKYISNADYPSGTYIHGDLNKNNSAYREGDCVPFKLVMTNLDPNATSETVVLEYDHFRAGNYGYWQLKNFAVDLGSNGTIDSGTVGSTITLSGVQNPADTDPIETITVNYTKPIGTTTATLYFCGELAKPFGAYGGVSSISGAPVHVGVVSGSECTGTNCNAYSIGNQDRSIQPSGIEPFGTLNITKSSSTVVVGQLASYTITVSNTGAGSATGVVVSDTLPAGTWTVSSSQNNCTGFPCTLGTIAAGGSATITVSRTTTVADCGTLVNTASVTSGNSGGAGPTTGTVTVLCPDVSVQKTAGAAVSAGGTTSFTIVVTAGGTGDSTNVTLTDTLPAGTWTIDPAVTGCSINTTSGVLTCNFGTLTNGSTRTVTIKHVTVAGDCPSISNTARVAATVDVSSTNNSSSATATVNCGAIGLTKTADAATVTAGSTIGYTLRVTNSGAGTATGVTITDTLPTTAGTSWTIDAANSDTGCTISSGVLTCNFGDLAPAASKRVHITSPTTTASCGTVSNSASATTTNNGSSSAGPTTITVLCPDVSVVKTASAAVSAGGTATFTIVVSAGGTGDSTSVTLADTLPAGTWTIGGPNAASCSITSGTLNCNFGTVANGTTRTVTLSRTTVAGDCPSISNTARVSAAVDVSTSNNSSSAAVTVNCGAIGLTKTADAATVTAGSTIGYTLRVTNSGAGTATGVTITDTLPTTAGTSWTIDAANSDTGCTISSGVLTCNFGDLAPAASKRVHITSPTTTASCGTVSNSASATTTNNGSSSAGPTTITVLCPDVSVVKTASAAVSAGGTATFTIVVSAGGTGDSTSVTLADTLPAGTWTIGGPNAASCSITSGTLNCNFGTVANGTTRTVTLSRTTVAGDCPSISNTARVSAAVDVSTSNNSSSAAVTVNCGAIGLTKTADAATVTAGSTIGYTLRVTNSGAGTATGVTITDTLPTTAGTSWTIDAANSDTGCTISSGVLTCNFGDLAPAASKRVHITSPTTTASCGTVSNSASATTTNNGSSSAGPTTITVNCPPPPPPPPPPAPSLTLNKVVVNDDGGTRAESAWTLTATSGTNVLTGPGAAGTNDVVSGPAFQAGTYTLAESGPGGYTASSWVCTGTGTQSGSTITLAAGQSAVCTITNNDNAPAPTPTPTPTPTPLVVILPPTSAGTVVVTKYNDLNANGRRDAGEPALSGWTFTLRNASGATVATATTAADGNATFTNIGFGSYTVVETTRPGWISSDPGGATPTKAFSMTSPATTLTFGNYQPRLPSTSTAAAPEESPSNAVVILGALLLAQGLLILVVFRRWRYE